MFSTVSLTTAELSEIVGAAFTYNGMRPHSIKFRGADGSLVDISQIDVVCDAQPLIVRVEPETDAQTLLRQMANAELQALHG